MLRGFRRRAGRAARGLGRRLRGWPTGRLVATAPKPGEPGRRDEVELWGPALEGGEGGWPGAPQRKWLGGTFSADGRWLIGVPSDAEWVLRLCTRTGKIDRLGEAVLAGLPKGKFKWLRGVTVGEHVFCIPACAECVLKVHPESGAVEALGLGLWPKGVWLWHGAALARDGNIYAIPANASRVLKISPATGEVALIGPELGAGPGTNLGAKWYGGILARDGTVWGVPYNAGAALRIDPATQEVRTVGDLPEGGWKWHGGRLAADGAIIGAPSHAESILRIQVSRSRSGGARAGGWGVGALTKSIAAAVGPQGRAGRRGPEGQLQVRRRRHDARRGVVHPLRHGPHAAVRRGDAGADQVRARVRRRRAGERGGDQAHGGGAKPVAGRGAEPRRGAHLLRALRRPARAAHLHGDGRAADDRRAAGGEAQVAGRLLAGRPDDLVPPGELRPGAEDHVRVARCLCV